VVASFCNFFSRRFGRDYEPYVETYGRHVERGGYVVVVDTSDPGEAERARRMLGDWQAGRGRLERHTTEFAGRYADADPAYRAFEQAGRSGCLATCVTREELPHPGHRRLMEEAGVTSRVALLYPAWYARGWLMPPWNVWFLLGTLAAAAAATSLRLHVWFTARTFPQQLESQQRSTQRWTRGCDVALATAQLAAALAVADGHSEFAMLFVTVAAAILVAAFVIEPATVSAAFADSDRDR
jgi:hypothetical protein